LEGAVVVTKILSSVSRFVVLLVIISSAALAQQHRAITSAVENPAIPRGTADAPTPADRNPRYRINPDDVLSVSFPLSPEFDQQKVTVQPDGYVTLLGAGSIELKGLTVPEAVEAVKKQYSQILHDPIVDIDLIDFQKPYFVVLGQVGKPGQYDLRYEMTVTEGVALAGGFAPTSKTRVLLYHRDGGGWVEAKELNLKGMLSGKNVTEDTEIRAGDMIVVQENAITKVRRYIPYGVGTYVNPSPAAY
jgi:polysaccharide export outer membrane protein